MTHRQKQVLDFIAKFIAEHGGVCPSFEEIKTGCGLKSKSEVHRMVWRLADCGHIRIWKQRARTIEVLTQREREIQLGAA